MTDETTVTMTLFVEHGRERSAAEFYAAAFGAEPVGDYCADDDLLAVEMRFGRSSVTVAGANPRREAEPARGGPFHPKAPGAVSAVIRLDVADIRAATDRALKAGATVRDDVQPSSDGRLASAVFDPFGHIWSLVEKNGAITRTVA